MKRLRFIGLITFSIFFLNCSEDENLQQTNGEGTTLQQVNKAPNLRPTGASANDLLSNANFTKLSIEIAYEEGFRPEAETINNFVDFLQSYTFKDEIEIIYKALNSDTDDELSLQEIADLEEKNRTVYNDEDTVAIYIYFADTPSVGDDLEEGLVTLGAVYRNTSMVIFQRTLREVAGRSLAISRADIETATLNHEFGHLFGLVNIDGRENGVTTTYTPMVNPHEDGEADDHCSEDICLMRAQLEFQDPNASATFSKEHHIYPGCKLNGMEMVHLLARIQTSGRLIVPDLGTECQLDLRANGGR